MPLQWWILFRAYLLEETPTIVTRMTSRRRWRCQHGGCSLWVTTEPHGLVSQAQVAACSSSGQMADSGGMQATGATPVWQRSSVQWSAGLACFGSDNMEKKKKTKEMIGE